MIAMLPLPHALEAASALAAQVLIASIWQAVLLAACVAGTLKLLPGTTASGRSHVLRGMLVAALLLPLLSLSLAAHKGGSGSGGTLQLGGSWSVLLLAAWGLAIGIRAVQLGMSALALRGMARRAVPLNLHGPVAEMIGRAMARAPRPAQLCCSPEVDRPSVIGFLHPRILLPDGLAAALSPAELEIIVLHELEHLRRHDDWMNLLQKLALVAVPFHPVLLWLDHRLSVERELACDDGVLQATGARKVYALTLTRLAEESLLRRGMLLALGAWERRSELAARVHRILAQPAAASPTQMRLAGGSTLALTLLAGAAFAHAPVLVSFRAADGPQPASSAVEHVESASAAIPKPLPEASFTQPHAVMTRAALPAHVPPRQTFTSLTSTSRNTPAAVPAFAIQRVPRRPERPMGQTLVTHTPLRNSAQPRITMTAWRATETRATQPFVEAAAEPQATPPAAPMPRVIFSVQDERGEPSYVPAYAAVPWGDGWLVIQL